MRRRPNTVDIEALTERIPLPNTELLEQKRETKPENVPPEAIRKSTFIPIVLKAKLCHLGKELLHPLTMPLKMEQIFAMGNKVNYHL